MQYVLSVVRPSATRLLARTATGISTPVTPLQSTQPATRSFHATAAAAAAATQTAAKAAEPAVAPKASDLLYVWGGGKSLLSRATMTSKPRNTPLTRVELRPTAFPSPDGTGFRDISFGHKHAAFITGSGDLYTFGSGLALGHGATVTEVDQPRRVEGLPEMVQVRCGSDHTIALSATGEVYTWGKGGGNFFFGTPSALGHKNKADCPRPTRVLFDHQERIVQIAAGSVHNMVLTEGGHLYGFGSGVNGRLGTGGSGSERTPVLIAALAEEKVVNISCGSSFNGALTSTGKAYTWGRNERGQLGSGPGIVLENYAMESMPIRVAFPDDTEETHTALKKLSCCYKHTLAIDAQDRIWLWGNGQLTPQLMIGDNDWMTTEKFSDVGGGNGFSAAIMGNGKLITWGSNSTGCLGTGDTSSRTNPAAVPGFGATPKEAQAQNENAWLGRASRILAGHNHVAVFAEKDAKQ